MKNFLFSVLLGAIVGWFFTKLLIRVDAETAFSQMYFFPSIIGFIHGMGWSVKTTCFIMSSIFFGLTGLSKWIGSMILKIIGIIILLMGITLVLMICFWIFNWMAGAL